MTTRSQTLTGVRKIPLKDNPHLILAIIALNALAAATLSISPILVGEMITSHSFSSAEAGYVISVEFGAMALATFPAYYWLTRVDIVKVIQLSILVIIIGNLICVAETLFQADFKKLIFMRFLVGLASGSIAVIILKVVSQLNNVTRGYALHALGEIGLGALGVATLPHLFSVTGLYIAYLLLALLALLSLSMVSQFRLVNFSTQDKVLAIKVDSSWVLGSLGLLGILTLYIGYMALWTYVERIGVTSGLSVIKVGYVLSAATIMGVTGSLLASILAIRVSHLLITVFGLMLVLLSVLTYLNDQTLLMFLSATCLARFSISLVLPFLYTTIAILDHTNRLVISLFLVIAIGVTIGPAIAAAIIGEGVDYRRIVLFSLLMLFFSSILLCWITFKSQCTSVFSPDEIDIK